MGDFKESKQTMKTVRPSRAGRERGYHPYYYYIPEKTVSDSAFQESARGGGGSEFS